MNYLEQIDKEKLKSLFSNMFNSYKIFWFKGLFEEALEGNKIIPFRNIVTRMISEAWPIILKLHANFGPTDQLESTVNEIREKYIREDLIDRKSIYNSLILSEDKELDNLLARFYDYVPYRLLAPFYKNSITGKKDREQNKIIEKFSQNDPEVLYKISAKDKTITINEKWFVYLNNNKDFTYDWINDELIKFIKNKNPDIENIKEEIESLNGEMFNNKIIKDVKKEEAIEFIHKFILRQGFNYDENLIKNLYISLKTKPFLILSGISGTGKSKIVELFAKALGATAENKRFNLVPVKPDWSDSTDLLGFRNIEGKFTPGIITKVCYKAMKDKEGLPYFICLDEMNLARVEYYFSDILSLMETRRLNQDNKIITSRLLNEEQMGCDEEAISIYGDVYIPQNLYIIGTVNMDETTFPFSKKVLDRANTIEFNNVDLNYNFEQVEHEELLPKNYHNDFLKSQYLKISECKDEKEIATEVINKLIEINNILEKYQQHFAYRVRDEIVFYVIYAIKNDLFSFDKAMDYSIVQKILPKINGSGGEVLDILVELFNILNSTEYKNDGSIEDEQIRKMEEQCKINKYELSSPKIIYMIRRFLRDGFTTFWQ